MVANVNDKRFVGGTRGCSPISFFCRNSRYRQGCRGRHSSSRNQCSSSWCDLLFLGCVEDVCVWCSPFAKIDCVACPFARVGLSSQHMYRSCVNGDVALASYEGRVAIVGRPRRPKIKKTENLSHRGDPQAAATSQPDPDNCRARQPELLNRRKTTGTTKPETGN